MLISKDLKYIFSANPKTGTRTIQRILADNSFQVGDHPRTNVCLGLSKMRYPDFSYENLEKIYVFWRDPVQRFISTANYLRSTGVRNIIKRHPSWFPGIQLPLDGPAGGRFTITQEILSLAAAITPEQIFDEEMQRRTAETPTESLPFFNKQSEWIIDEPKLEVLDFADFENNAKKVISAFGMDADTTSIIKVNESIKLTTSISPELEARVKEYYAEDYSLKP
jgi:hypothetical protein